MNKLTRDYVKFFKDLAANNNRDWFHAQKKRYEESVKLPFTELVNDLAKQVHKYEPITEIDPKKMIFRVHRDVRFSKDKTPYKTSMSAIVAPGGRKEMEKPTGFYFEMGPEHVRVYSGAYMISKERLMSLRKHIAKDPKAITKLTKAKAFVNHFGELRGEKNKRIDKSFLKVQETQPLIFNKQFYFFEQFKPSLIVNKDLKKSLLGAYRAGRPMAEYLRKGMGYK